MHLLESCLQYPAFLNSARRRSANSLQLNLNLACVVSFYDTSFSQLFSQDLCLVTGSHRHITWEMPWISSRTSSRSHILLFTVSTLYSKMCERWETVRADRLSYGLLSQTGDLAVVDWHYFLILLSTARFKIAYVLCRLSPIHQFFYFFYLPQFHRLPPHPNWALLW